MKTYNPNCTTNTDLRLTATSSKAHKNIQAITLATTAKDGSLNEISTINIEKFVWEVDEQVEQINKDGYIIKAVLPKKDKLIFLVKKFESYNDELKFRINLAKRDGLCQDTIKTAYQPKISKDCKMAIIERFGQNNECNLKEVISLLTKRYDDFEMADEAVLKALLEEGYDYISFE